MENCTTKTYSFYFEKLKISAAWFSEVNELAADKFHIVLFIIHFFQTTKTFPVIRMSYFATNYFHSIVGYQNRCSSSLLYNVLEGIKRLLAYTATNKLSV